MGAFLPVASLNKEGTLEALSLSLLILLTASMLPAPTL
jgi:hypothetical protein